MKKAILIHGSYGNPNENWFLWLKKELENNCHNVTMPLFPTPKDQSLENWMKVFEPYLININKETVFIGHSLGATFILSVLEKINIRIKACFLVAGFKSMLNIDEFDSVNKSFINKVFDWEKIKGNCENFYIYHSDNDPYVPLEQGQELASKLEAVLTVIKDAGHFNEKFGYITFEKLLEDIRNLK